MNNFYSVLPITMPDKYSIKSSKKLLNSRFSINICIIGMTKFSNMTIFHRHFYSAISSNTLFLAILHQFESGMNFYKYLTNI